MGIALRHFVLGLSKLGGIDETFAQGFFGLIARILLLNFDPSCRQLVARFQRLLRCGIKKESDNGAAIATNLSSAWRSPECVTAEQQHSRKASAACEEYLVALFSFNFHDVNLRAEDYAPPPSRYARCELEQGILRAFNREGSEAFAGLSARSGIHQNSSARDAVSARR